MSVFISDKDMAKLYVQFLDQNNSKSKKSARMSWSMSALLKPLKKLAGVSYQVQKLLASLSF